MSPIEDLSIPVRRIGVLEVLGQNPTLAFRIGHHSLTYTPRPFTGLIEYGAAQRPSLLTTQSHIINEHLRNARCIGELSSATTEQDHESGALHLDVPDPPVRKRCTNGLAAVKNTRQPVRGCQRILIENAGHNDWVTAGWVVHG